MSQPESRFSRQVMEFLRKQGGWCFKVHGSSMQPSGIPDVIGTYRGLFVGVEDKMPGNDLSDIQRFRITRIRDAGGLVCVAYNLGDVKQFLHHIDTLHFAEHDELSGLMAAECELYGKGAGFDALP